jgi:hypothetical protein
MLISHYWVRGVFMNKLHEVEEGLRSSRHNAGPAVNGFELWFAVLIILNALGFFADRELPDRLPDMVVVARLYMVISICFFIAGLGIIAGLMTRLVIIEMVGVFTFSVGLAIYAFLLIAFAFSSESLSFVFVLTFGIYACLGRLGTLKRL